jgi:integrase
MAPNARPTDVSAPAAVDGVPTRRLELTDAFLRTLKAGPAIVEYRDTVARGLIVRVLPSGLVQFSIRYRTRGRQRRAVLGNYSASALTLAKARTKATRTLLAAQDGDDPAEALREAKAKPVDTIDALAADYLKRYAPRKRTAAEDARVLNVEILPRWRDRSVRDLTRRDVRALLEAIVDRGAPVMANRVLAVIRKMLNYAVDRDWLDANPAARMSKPTVEVSRDRVLTDDEVRKVWRCLTNLPTTAQLPAPNRKRAKGAPADPLCPISPRQAALLQVRLLTAQRGGEVARMRWQDVDLEAGWWTIPAEHAKNGQTHRVPLVGKALELVKAQQPKKPDRVRSKADKDEPAYVFTDGETGAQDRAKKAPGLVSKAIGIAFRGHDLRRTAATKMAEAGISHSDIGKVLNHAEGGPRATAVYNRYQADREKRIALETWDRVLTGIILTKKPAAGAVVPITRKAAR